MKQREYNYMDEISGYSIYNKKAKNSIKINPLEEIYPSMPNKKYSIIYADPPWDYGGKMQYDKSSIKTENIGFKKDIFISSASFKYPTLTINELKNLDIKSISEDNCLLFMWTTGPQLSISIELGMFWGFEYRTIAFIWDKMIHNPGRYTLSQTELCLVFKRGKIPTPRGAKNIKQLVTAPRGNHSEKPEQIIDGITKMFPEQKKIELFARKNYLGWDNWGLEIPDNKIEILDNDDIVNDKQISLF